MTDISNISASEWCNILASMHSQFAEIERLNIAITKENDRHLQLGRTLRKFTRFVSPAMCIVTFLVVFFIRVALGYSGLGWLIVAAVAGWIGGGLLYEKVIVELIMKKDRTKSIQKELELRNKIGEIFGTIPNLDYLPAEYYTFWAIDSLYRYFKNGRATNWKEAVNLYEEECHRKRMEEMAGLQAQAAMNAEIYAKSTANAVHQMGSQINGLNSGVNHLNSQMAQVNTKLHLQ